MWVIVEQLVEVLEETLNDSSIRVHGPFANFELADEYANTSSEIAGDFLLEPLITPAG